MQYIKKATATTQATEVVYRIYIIHYTDLNVLLWYVRRTRIINFTEELWNTFFFTLFVCLFLFSPRFTYLLNYFDFFVRIFTFSSSANKQHVIIIIKPKKLAFRRKMAPANKWFSAKMTAISQTSEVRDMRFSFFVASTTYLMLFGLRLIFHKNDDKYK